jgi:hypothetical protein
MAAFIRNATIWALYALAIVDLLLWVETFATDEGPRLIADGVRAIYVLTFVTALGLAALLAGKSASSATPQ